jgi:hypothetical protein
MKTDVWKAAVAGVALFILGVAAGAATIDMLDDEAAPSITGAETVTSVETRTTTAVETRTVRRATVDPLPAGWSRCTNAERRFRRYSIGYPGGWYTSHLTPEQACEYFDPEPFEILAGTEFPPTALFVTVALEPVDRYVDQLTDPMFFDTIRREDTTVGGRPAVLVETVATGEGESEPGERRYGYVVDIGCANNECVKSGRVFVVLATGLPDDERYEEFKAVADEAVKTAQFLGR